MPREKTVTVYKFSELSEKAKDAFRYRYKADEGYLHADEVLDVLRKLADHFGGKLTDWGLDFFECSPSFAKFDMPDTMDTETWSGGIAAKLAELGAVDPKTGKGLGECKLTGYFLDEAAIDGFRDAYNGGERDLVPLMQAAFESLMEEAIKDCEDQYSDSTFAEHCDANEWEFYADGRMAK